MIINIRERAGVFAENKDIGRDIRVSTILPALEAGNDVILDFEGVESATQSFIHSIISDVIRQHGAQVLDRLKFKSCGPTVRSIIGIVVEYMQRAMASDRNKGP